MKGKKIRKIPILLLLVGFLSFVSWSGAGAADLNLDDQVCAPMGSTVSFTATINNAPNSVSSLGFEIIFDDNVLTYLDFTPGELVQDFLLFDVNNASPGILRVAGITISPIPVGASGNLVMLNFTVAAAEASDLTFQNLVDNVEGWTTKNGSFCEVGIAIRGKVLDLEKILIGEEGGVPGIRVSIATPADYTSIDDTSGPDGDYELGNFPPNTEDVSILCSGGAGFVNTYTAFFKTGVQDIEEDVYITPQAFYDGIDEDFGVTQEAGKGIIAGAVLDLDLEGKAGAKVSTEPSYDVFYFAEDGNPDPTLEETSSNGLFIIFNIDVGDVEVTATMSPAFATTKARAYADSVTVAPVAEVIEGEEVPPGDGDGGWCFVATAAFGSPLESHVQMLRDFRDRYLVSNPIGRAFVSLYYKYSPPIADFIAKNGVLRGATRVGLYPVAGLRYIPPHGSHGGMLTLAILLIGGVGVGIFIHRRRRST